MAQRKKMAQRRALRKPGKLLSVDHPLCRVLMVDVVPPGAAIYDSSPGEWSLADVGGALFWRPSLPDLYLTHVDFCLPDLDRAASAFVGLSTALRTDFVLSGPGLLGPAGDTQFGHRAVFSVVLVHPGERAFSHCGENLAWSAVPRGVAVCFLRDHQEDRGRLSFDVVSGRAGITLFERPFVLRLRSAESGLVPA